MSPFLTAAMLVLGLAFFAFTMTRRLAPLAALRPDVRWDRAGERIRTLLAFGFGQRRLPDRGERVPGVLHVLIFAAFIVLAIRTITLFGIGLADGFHLPLLAEDAPLGQAYLFVKDLVVLGALAGVAGFLWRRLVTKPDRVTLSTEGVVILLFIAGLMLTDMAYDGARLLLDRGAPDIEAMIRSGTITFHPPRALPPFTPGTPSGWLGAAAVHGLGVGEERTLAAVAVVALVLHLALILVFLNVLPYGKHF